MPIGLNSGSQNDSTVEPPLKTDTPQQRTRTVTHDNSESPDCPSIHFSPYKQPLSEKWAPRYNGQFLRSQLYTNNT